MEERNAKEEEKQKEGNMEEKKQEKEENYHVSNLQTLSYFRL